MTTTKRPTTPRTRKRASTAKATVTPEVIAVLKAETAVVEVAPDPPTLTVVDEPSISVDTPTERLNQLAKATTVDYAAAIEDAVRRLVPVLAFIYVTALYAVETAVKTKEFGAFSYDFLTKQYKAAEVAMGSWAGPSPFAEEEDEVTKML